MRPGGIDAEDALAVAAAGADDGDGECAAGDVVDGGGAGGFVGADDQGDLGGGGGEGHFGGGGEDGEAVCGFCGGAGFVGEGEEQGCFATAADCGEEGGASDSECVVQGELFRHVDRPPVRRAAPAAAGASAISVNWISKNDAPDR